MAHGVGEVLSDGNTMKMSLDNHQQQVVIHQQSLQQQQQQQQHQQQQSNAQNSRKNVGVMGSRRIFAAAFKLKVLDSYRNDIDCRGNQRATARKYGIHRRQIQKWLQCEDNLRNSCADNSATTTVTSSGCCTVPVVASNVNSVSPVMNLAGQGDVISKIEATTTSTSSSSSSSVSSSSLSSISRNSNSPKSNSNGSNSTSSINVVGSAGTPIVTPTATAVTPALNLSLARLHGDEQQQQQQQQHQQQQQQQLAARQGPPPHPTPGPPGLSGGTTATTTAAPLRHSGRRGSSPTSSQYLQHNQLHQVSSLSSSNAVPLRSMLVGYNEYASQQETVQHRQNHQRHQRRQQQQQRHEEEQHLRERQDPTNSPERKYSSYIINRSPNFEHRDILSGTGSSSHSSNSEAGAYYQTLGSYQNNTGFVSLRHNNNNNNNNNNNENVKDIGLVVDGASSSYRDKKNNANSSGNVCESLLIQSQTSTSFASSASSSLLLHATTIKSERASPDSLATPGPCEMPGSPESVVSLPRARYHQHQQQHQHQLSTRRLTDISSDTCNTNLIDVSNTNAKNNLVNGTTMAATTATAAAITNASPAVHLNETTSPLPQHVYVSVDSHMSNTRDSEKQQQQPLPRDTIKAEYEEIMGRRRVKEEVAEGEEVETTMKTSSTTTPTMMMMMTMMTRESKGEISEDEAVGDGSNYHREGMTTDVVASCLDYQGTTTETPSGLSSGRCSGPVSPIVRESTGSYSGLSSPRAASSSGISTSSSCSDSEMDPLDYSSGSTRNPVNDLSRRRSFSLRFKLDVLDAFHRDVGVAGNQRATARKFGINRRQVQKWLGQENELRGEIALRGGDLRQRLGPMSEANSNELSSIPVDLRTSSLTNCLVSGMRSGADIDQCSPPLYCCDVGSTSQKLGYYHQGNFTESSEIPMRSCTLSCCVDGHAGASIMCYQESASHRRSSIGYPESQSSLYCYSPRDNLDNNSGSEGIDVTMSSSPLKRSSCTLTCCYDILPSPKRICIESLEETRSNTPCQDLPPQDVPLCLVKPKGSFNTYSLQTEPVTSTVPTPPAQPVVQQPPAAPPSTKKDGILFKPYLDNPVSKPTEESDLLNPHQNNRGLSPSATQSVIVNNNNCHSICNLNEARSVIPNTQQHDYALELSLRVPVSWRTHHGNYTEFPERFRSAFVRYPTSPHYT